MLVIYGYFYQEIVRKMGHPSISKPIVALIFSCWPHQDIAFKINLTLKLYVHFRKIKNNTKYELYPSSPQLPTKNSNVKQSKQRNGFYSIFCPHFIHRSRKRTRIYKIFFELNQPQHCQTWRLNCSEFWCSWMD